MSTPSLLLFGGGVAASLSGVWALAGLSERSEMRSSLRAISATVLGVFALAVIYLQAPGELRGALLLPALFAAVAVLALGAGAGKLDTALADRNGARAARRAAGLVAGTFLAMASVAAVSFELLTSSASHARFGWAYMLPVVVSVVTVFARRSRLAGAGALLLGSRGLVYGVVGLALLGTGRLLVSARSSAVPEPSTVSEPRAAAPEANQSAIAAPRPASEAAAANPATTPAEGAPAPSAVVPPATGSPGELLVEGITTRGMLEADAHGGVRRRFDKLQACLSDPHNGQSGSLSLKIGIDGAGSVSYAKVAGGDLVGTPLATCLLPVFYKMGFAAPPSTAHFEITLRAPPR